VKGLDQKQLLEEIRKRDAIIEELRVENALLRRKVDLLVHKIFGASSEKLGSAQLDLFLLNLEDTPGKPEASSLVEEAEAHRSHRRHSPREEKWPTDLPVVEQVIDPEEVKAEPEQWRCIGQEVSEQLDYEPARFLRRRLIRRKYVSKTNRDTAPVIAELPPMLQERCVAAPGLLAHLIVSKYCDHLPLYRQEQIYWTRHRVWLPRQTQARWMELAADWLRPIYEAIRTGVMAGGYVQVDETPLRYLAPGNGKTKLGYFWTASRPGGDVVYQWQTSRGAACLDKVLPVDFKGTLQCDAYSAYGRFARDKEHLQLAGCWAHARRKFYEARDRDPLQAAWVLRQLMNLYRIERELREHRAGPRLRAAVRAHQSRPIIARLHHALRRWKLTRRFWLPRQSQARWVGMVADWFQPIYHAIRSGVMAGGYVQVDETPVRYLAPGNGKTKTGYFWTTSRPGGDVVYRWEISRAATCLDKVLPVDFKGTVQCDGYAAYASFARRKEHIHLAACWAHARRKFYEAQEQDPGIAHWALRQIGHLYRIERELRESKTVATLRAVARAHQARPIYQRLHRLFTQLKTRRRYLPRSRMGLALDYTLNLWPLLGVYLDDGRLEIDQNLVENAIRPTALGKRNWLFIGEAEAGERSAILYTIVECCRRRGLDPFAYLRDILTRLAPKHGSGIVLPRRVDRFPPGGKAGSLVRNSPLAQRGRGHSVFKNSRHGGSRP
jgi:transposase